MFATHPVFPNYVKIHTKADLEALVDAADYVDVSFFLADTGLEDWKELKDQWFTMHFNKIVRLSDWLN